MRWDIKREWMSRNQGQGTQKTSEHILFLIPLSFPSSQEVIIPWVVVRMPTLSNDTLAALFQEDQSPSQTRPHYLPSVLGGAELFGPGWLRPFYRWKQQGHGLMNWLTGRSSVCWRLPGQCCLLVTIMLVWISQTEFLPWSSYYQPPLPFPKCPVLLFPFCAFILGLESSWK